MKLTSARLPSSTPVGAGAQCRVCVSSRLMMGRMRLNHIAARTLGQTVADLLADNLILYGIATLFPHALGG